MTENACCVWDFTVFDELSVHEMREKIGPLCKKYAFQLEKGKTKGTLHYQGRISLKLKVRKNQVIKMFDDLFEKHHISITSTANKDNDFYVMKEDTRIEGPFTDLNNVYIPRDIREIKELLPWQDRLEEVLRDPDNRTVDVVYDENGNSGKSTFTRYMMLFKGAQILPMCNDYKDIMRMAMDIGPKKIYLIDMPRSINKEKLYQFYAGIETLKGGYAYDDRYTFKQILFDPPRICIFTNRLPDRQMLSKDRWRIWMIDDGVLEPYKEPVEESSEEGF